MRSLALLALLAFAGCSQAQVQSFCKQDAAIQPAAAVAVQAAAPVVALSAPAAAPVAGVAVVAAQVDTAAIHPAVVDECNKLTAPAAAPVAAPAAAPAAK